MDNACIVGNGTVGKATAYAFGIKEYMSKSDFNISWGDIRKKRYIFICLPTPTFDGVCYTKDIEDVIDKLLNIHLGANEKKVLIAPISDDVQNIFIIRSTVYPGFNKKLQERYPGVLFVSNPEFLSEDSANYDAAHPDLIIIGSDNAKARDAVRGVYEARFKAVPMVITDATTAELIKLSLNAFFATKVVFANQIYDYAQKVGANYETIKKVLTTHPWGSKNHFTIFHKGGRGAGGKCLRKDLESFTFKTNSEFFKMVRLLNEQLLTNTGKK